MLLPPLSKDHTGPHDGRLKAPLTGKPLQMPIRRQLGACIVTGALSHTQCRNLHHTLHAHLGTGIEQGYGGERMNGLNGSAGRITQDAHCIDDGVDARESGQPDGRSMIPRVIDHHLVRQTPGMGNPGQHVVPFGLQGTHEGSAHESRGTAQQNVHDLFS